MEYKVVYGESPSELTRLVSENLQNGWELSGSHQVVIRRQQNRYRGDQMIDTFNEIEYSQTLIKNNNGVL